MKEIGKIHFSDDNFYGREFELSQLVSSYSRLTSGKNVTEIVLIGGYAGIGKSRLVDAFHANIKKSKQHFYFLRGKSDKLLSPCSSLVDSFSEWCKNLLATGDQEEISSLRTAILQAVGDEGKVLTDLIPQLKKLIGEQPETPSVSDNTRALNQLKNLFEKFVKSISREKRPVILFLDDLQWVDAASLDLLTLIVADPTVKHFMFIGTYRDNEVDEEHILLHTLERIRMQGKSFLSLSLGNLSLEDVKELVAGTLSLEANYVEPLAKALFERTLGNPFYVQTSLQILERKCILVYSYASLKWTWEIEKVSAELSLSENVVSMVLDKLESLDVRLQKVISIASFLRSTFYLDTLYGILHTLAFPLLETKEALVCLLEVAVKDGLLENMIGSPSYKFAHDRIQQAAHMLVQGDEQYTLKMTVGKYILNQRPTEDSEGLFLAVDLFNSVPLLLLRQHLEIDRIIELNVEVAEAACRISAFAAATNNLYRGIELMESVDNRWNEHYNLCLRLYNSACEVEFCVGDFQRAQGYCDEVLAYAKSFDEKLRAYQAKSDGLGQRERHADALEIDKEVLTNLGQAPRYTNMLNVIIQLSSMKSTMAKTSDDEIRGLPLLQDEKLIIAIETLSKMATRAFYCDQKFLSLLCVIRQLQLTLKYGLTQASSYAIAGYGTMCHMALGEEKLGLRMASLAFDVAKITKAKAYEAKILFTLTNFIKPWEVPLPKLMDSFNRGYQAGMTSGDIEFACLSHLAYSIHTCLAGFPIITILEECQELRGLLEHYNVKAVMSILVPFQYFLLALAGQNKEPLNYFTEEIQFPKKKSMVSNSLTLKLLSAALYGMQTAFYLGDMATADRLRKELDKYKEAEPTYSCMSTSLMFSSLIATELYRQTGKRKHLNRSRKALCQTKHLMSRKGLNLLHKYRLMEADYLSTITDKKQRKTDIRKKFDEAISTATRAGFMQDAAIANELCGEYLARAEDDFWPKIYLTKAHDLYKSWGAEGKVKQLLDRRGSLIDSTYSSSKGKMSSTRKSRAGMTSKSIQLINDIETARDEGGKTSFLDSTQFSQQFTGSINSSTFSFGQTGAQSSANIQSGTSSSLAEMSSFLKGDTTRSAATTATSISNLEGDGKVYTVLPPVRK